MKKSTLGFAAIVALSLCSFAMFHTADAPPVDKALYAKYLENFKKVELPYTIEKNHSLAPIEPSANVALKSKSLGYEYADFIPELAHGSYSRMGPDHFDADALVAQTEEFNAVVYMETPAYAFRRGMTLKKSDSEKPQRSKIEDEDKHVNRTFILSTIDKKGNLISKQNIAFQHGSNEYQTATINRDLSIKIDTYRKDANGKNQLQNTYNLYVQADGRLMRNGEYVGNVAQPAPQKLEKANPLKLDDF
jgi:hypothetical protein